MHKLLWIFLLLSFCAIAQEQTERFDIKRIAVVGNTLLPAAEVDQLTAPFLGPRKEYGDIQRVLEALELAYRQRGYTAVQVFVPEQELTDGVVKLQVIESVIDKLTINTETKYFDAANLRAGLPALREGTTPNTFDLSSQIALNNESPAKQIEVILGVSEKEGRVDAKINVAESNPVRFSVGLDNTGSSQTGEHRLSVAVQHANLFNRDHVITASYLTSPEKFDQIKIGSLSYRLPFYAYGGAMDFIYAKSNVDAGTTATTAGPLSFTGKGDVFSFKYTHTLPRQGAYSSKLVFGFDYKKYDNDCSLGSFGALGCGAAAASVTLRPVSITYSGLKVGPGQATDYSLTLVKNIPGGSKGDDAAFAAVRPSPLGEAGPRSDYQALRLSLTHLRIFQGDWQIRAALNAQYTDQPLLAQEQ
ncbi:MAG: ShlB/FhaC/HecB family hemolysin secretion/activation protein, partial [Proteobacteria bacterium]|nr:ShlB/FhaC/HecB family hemolysin secretion/activation protein [Pseudomonadota bacterium]